MPEETPNQHQYCPFAEPQFQRQVVEGLAILKTQAEQTNQHLRNLNGSVARHEQQLGELREWKATQEASQRTDRRWTKRIASAAWAIVGGVAGVLAKKFLPI